MFFHSFGISKCQVDRAVVEVTSPDGSNKRKLGMFAVLSSVPGLYKPHAFGGAVIDDPWECMKGLYLGVWSTNYDFIITN